MISLRPLQAADADEISQLVQETPAAQTALGKGSQSIEAQRHPLEQPAGSAAQSEVFSFSVVEISSGRVAGWASIHPDSQRLTARLDMCIGAAYQGRGYGSHSIRWLLVYGFERLGLEKMEAAVLHGNDASQQVYKKNGFQMEAAPEEALPVELHPGRRSEQPEDRRRLALTRARFLDMEERLIVHLTAPEAWQAALQNGEYRAPSLESEGFIHLSRPDQLAQVGNNFYRSLPQAVLLWVDPQQVEGDVRWEAAGEQVFPHLYGPLPVKAVLAAPVLPRTASGGYLSVPKA